MRELQFKGYLKKYIKDVSGSDTLSVAKLVRISKKNYRLTDSIILYCVLENKSHLFNKYSKGKFADIIDGLSKNNFLSEKYKERDFSKIWDGYQHRSNVTKYDNAIKNRIRINILKEMKKRKMSNYRIYTDLKLNPGNINDFLTNGNASKVSLDLVERIYQYVNGY